MTTTVPRPNRDALDKAIGIYTDAMRPFIMRGLRRVRGSNPEQAVLGALLDNQREMFRDAMRKPNATVESLIEPGHFPRIVGGRLWREVFSQEFQRDNSIQSRLWIIATARNNTAHRTDTDLDTDATVADLLQVEYVLGSINAPDEQSAVQAIRRSLTPVSEPQQPQPAPRLTIATGPRGSSRASPRSLKPWRDVIKPNQDVQLGTFRQAEFAADLQQVYDGRAEQTQYGDPASFFAHTYVTPGIRTLLTNVLRRISGNGGDPVIQTKTGFGGGKTHSLIALLHLARDPYAILGAPDYEDDNESTTVIRDVARDAGMNPDAPDSLITASVAVLDGTHLATTDQDTTAEGDPLNTLWGVMAYQLGGQEAYELVGVAARQGTSPGAAQLNRLFEHVGPCVILIDELVAYVRNAGMAKDNIYTFIQSLTQAVRRSDNAALVVTLIESEAEAGGPEGVEALTRLDNIFGRIEAVWQPLEVEEAFEVVRRRLFGAVVDAAERDKTCEAFSRRYGQRRSDYPNHVSEQRYLERMKSCYPIHPEIFDRLYEEWSTFNRFQRTRGVLRMMAVCVSRLYRTDDSPLIMPGSLPLNDPDLANVFDSILPGNWHPVLTEVDSNGGRTDRIDAGSARFQDMRGAARRIARTVFLGSSGAGAVRGIDARDINLGVVMPGEGPATYRDALSQMAGELYYLYSQDGRYYFHAEENLNKVATDRADAIATRELDERIKAFLEEAMHSRYRNRAILCPETPADVADVDRTRVVALSPPQSLPSRASDPDDAKPVAEEILTSFGEGRSRLHKNTLLFLAAKKDEIRALRRNIRQYIAWRSITTGDARINNLVGERFAQARDSATQAEASVRSSLTRAYRWALNPVQPDPQDASYEIVERMTDAGSDSADFVGNALDTFIRNEILVAEISPSALSNLLDQRIWNSEAYKNHISVSVLWEMMTQYVYMTRLDERDTLIRCIRRGVQEGRFGVAPSSNNDYEGIRFQEDPQDALGGFNPILLVEPETAEAAKLLHQQPAVPPEPGPNDTPRVIFEPDGPSDPDGPFAPPTPRGPRQIVASKTTYSDISLDDVSLLREEVIRSLREDGGDITVEIIVRANKSDGFSERIAQAVLENGIQLGLNLEQTP